MQIIIGCYTKSTLFLPTKISQPTIEATTTQEEVIVVGGDSTVGEDTAKVDSKKIHPEDQDVGVVIKMVT